nr:hypothetical protein [Candidatus Arsenophonus triatominarum]
MGTTLFAIGLFDCNINRDVFMFGSQKYCSQNFLKILLFLWTTLAFTKVRILNRQL